MFSGSLGIVKPMAVCDSTACPVKFFCGFDQPRLQAQQGFDLRRSGMIPLDPQFAVPSDTQLQWLVRRRCPTWDSRKRTSLISCPVSDGNVLVALAGNHGFPGTGFSQDIVESDRMADTAGDIDSQPSMHPGPERRWRSAGSMFVLGLEFKLFEPRFPLVGVFVAVEL